MCLGFREGLGLEASGLGLDAFLHALSPDAVAAP